MKRTVQKDVILEAVRSNHDHPTADRIYADLKEDNPKLSLGTVYRNLNHFADQGMIARFTPPNQSTRFDFNIVPHEHIICESCAHVADIFQDMDLSALEEKTNFQVTGYSLTVYGLCPNCKRNNLH